MFESVKITPSSVKGALKPPPSKSHSQRAILLGAMGWGTTTINHYLDAPDIHAMVVACRHLGATIDVVDSSLSIKGIRGEVNSVEDVIHVGNSGIVLRFLTAIAALGALTTVITGDWSIRHQRPMNSLLDALKQLGVTAFSARDDGYAPIIVRGPLKGGVATIDGQDSQPISALLLASLFAHEPLELKVINPGETPWVDMTLWWMRKLGAKVCHTDHTHYHVTPIQPYQGFEYTIPSDMSSAAFPLAAALITGGSIELHQVDCNDCQGDKELFDIFKAMGADITTHPGCQKIIAKGGRELQGIEADLNGCIDAVPILAAVACFAKTPTHIRNVANAAHKESNRLMAISQELTKMGASVTLLDDGLHIVPSVLKGATVKSYDDHRIAMSLTVAALAATGPSHLVGYSCISKSYPQFLDSFVNLGADIVGIS